VLAQVQENFMAQVTTYYQANSSWQDIHAHFLPPGTALSLAPRSGQQPRPPAQERVPQQATSPAYVFALVDLDGRVVMPAGSYRLDDRVSTEELAQGVEVVVDGQVVGFALVTGAAPELGPQEVQYLARTSRSSLYAALAATAIALVLGALLARAFTRPVRELTAATHALARGDLAQHVPVRSQDELGDLAASFNQMSADLARANALRRQMTADIAHDLRTPLTVIAGYLESMRDGVLKPSQARFETMYTEARHLQHLVEDLRTLSLADAGELSLDRQPTQPRALLDRLVAAYRHRAGQQGVELRVQAEPDLPEIHVDPERMVQVLGNLIGNALRYTPEGGQIVLSARAQARAVQLVVADAGAGISPEDLPHVFDRFYRGDASRQQQGGESGLGLAITKSIVEAHGGSIGVESEPGTGTTFTIALPVCL